VYKMDAHVFGKHHSSILHITHHRNTYSGFIFFLSCVRDCVERAESINQPLYTAKFLIYELKCMKGWATFFHIGWLEVYSNLTLYIKEAE
jgi:hypothetical protein